MRRREAGKKYVCKHITVRPDQSDKIRNWPHGLLSMLTQDALDALSDSNIDEDCLKEALESRQLNIKICLKDTFKSAKYKKSHNKVV